MSGSLGSLAGPEYVAKVNRVLEAARLWRRMHGDDRRFSALAGGLIDAIDALDAPQERYIVSGSDVMCNNTIYDTVARREVSILEACRVLNAQERTP